MELYLLYSLCDFAQVFARDVKKTNGIDNIPNDVVEAIVVAYLNHYATFYKLPLTLYRSDLYDNVCIVHEKIPSDIDIKSHSQFIIKFCASNCSKLINSNYGENTQLLTKVNVSSEDAHKTLTKFLKEYKKWIATTSN